MDSPEASRKEDTSTSSSSQYPPPPEFPFPTYLNSLSPIRQPVKTYHVEQYCILDELDSPTLIFESEIIGGENLIEDPYDCKKLSEEPLLLSEEPKTVHQEKPAYVVEPGKIQDVERPTQEYRNELDSPTIEYTPQRIVSPRATLFFESDIIGGENLIEDPYDSKKLSEEPLLLSEEPKTVHQEKPAYADEPGKIQDVEWPSQECRKLDSNLSADIVLDKQHCHDSNAQRAVNELQDHQDCTPQLMPEPLRDVKECEECGEMGPTLHLSAEKMSRDGSEACQKHCVLRHCLQLEEAASNALGSNNSPLPAHIREESVSSAPSSVSKDLKASYMPMYATSNKKKMVKLSEPITSLLPPQFRGNFPVTGSKPSGIGLHLNSIVNSMPPGRTATTGMELAEGLESTNRYLISSNMDGKSSCATSSKKKMVKLSEPITSLVPPRFRGNFPVTGSKPSGIVLHLNSIMNSMPPGHAATTGMGLAEGLEIINRYLNSSNMEGKSSVGTVNERHAIDTSVAAHLSTSDSPSLTEPFTSLYPASVHDNKKPSLTYAGNSEEFNQPRPSKKKNRRPITTGDRKPCTCNKIACMKLYCICFAAEIYCAELCSCQGCLNRPEYEDKVRESKQKIESRDPLAFAPKIVQHATDIPSNNMEDDNLETPSSARHKRGCNCRLSKCLKNYCECYEINVGCSSGCRCEGCENSYGKKEDYFAILKDALSKENESCRVEKLPDVNAELHDNDVHHHLSPLTPSLQCSDMSQSSLSNVSHLSAPLSNPTSMSGASIGETTNLQCLDPPNSSSGGLIRGRKFILKSVPSFPPLTPYIDSKGNGDEEDSAGDRARE